MSDSIVQNFGKPVTITRPTEGAWVRGKWTPNAETEEIVTKAVIQPASPRETDRLPEAYQDRQTVRIYVDVQIYATVIEGAGDPRRGDEFTWKGRDYEVVGVEDRSDGDLPHYKGLAVMKGV